MFLLNMQSKQPIYEQIKTQILRFIEAGVLMPGDRLPSVRQLAQDNGINPNTVAKAYAELERAGYVYNMPKKGVYVAEIDVHTDRNAQIVKTLNDLLNAGYTKQEILEVTMDFCRRNEDAENQPTE